MQTLGSFDYVIVGAGSAGCVLANRLSSDPRNRVCLIEAGGRDNYVWIHIPIGYLYCMGNSRTDWCFRTVAEPGLNGRSLAYPRGRVLGGCSAINGMIYMRGQARDYDLWRQLGNPGWAWDDVLGYFKKSEDMLAIEPGHHHGSGGEWRVESPRVSWEILDAFADAAEQAGLPKVNDFNRGNNEGVGYFHVNQRRGFRWTTARGFLKPARERANLTILTHAMAERLLLSGRQAEGVVIEHEGERKMVRSDGEVILAAGAIGSPQLLQLSGVGPGDVLGEHGIPVAHELTGVGENLQDHLQIRCVYRVEGVRTLNERANSLLGKLGIGMEYLFSQSGPMSMAPSQLGAFAKSDPDRETPNIQYHIQPLSLDKFGAPLHNFPAFTASVCNLRPQSRGHVRIISANPADAPEIRPNYLSATADRQVAADAIHFTRRIVGQRALQQYRPRELKPGEEFQDDEELARLAGDIATTIFHPVGTCKMGSDDGAVVDARLRVHGTEGLRIADASIMPTITSGNTNSPTIMIAEKASDMILQDHSA